jgi:hypothetical protein
MVQTLAVRKVVRRGTVGVRIATERPAVERTRGRFASGDVADSDQACTSDQGMGRFVRARRSRLTCYPAGSLAVTFGVEATALRIPQRALAAPSTAEPNQNRCQHEPSTPRN